MVHIKNDYRVKIGILDNTFILIDFPKNIFLKKPKLSALFTITNNSLLGTSSENNEVKEIFINKYCFIPYLVNEIIKESTSRGMNQELIDLNPLYQLSAKILNEEELQKQKRILVNNIKYIINQPVDIDIMEDIENIHKESFFENIIS